MINLFYGLVRSVLEAGYPEFLKNGFDVSLLKKEEIIILNEIKEHYETYKTTPSFEVLEEICQTSFRSVPKEPMDFWITHLKKNYLHNFVKEKSLELANFNENNQIEEFCNTCKEIIFVRDSMNQNTTIEPLFCPDRFEKHIFDVWNNMRDVQTPWEQFNERLSGGFKPSELTCFAARPGVGKTMFLLLCAIWAWKQGKKVLIVSTEMSIRSLQIRGMFFAKIHDQLSELRKGQILPDVKDWLMKSLRELENSDKLSVVAGKFDLLVDTVEAQLISYKPDILFIDGVYLMKIDKNGKYMEKHLRIAAVFDRLKELAQFYDIPIVVNSQLNRGNNKSKDQKLDLDRMSFSDNVGMVSDNAIMLVQDDDDKAKKQMVLNMVKIREGDSMDDVIINWNFHLNNFTEVKKLEPTALSQFAPPDEEKKEEKKYTSWGKGYKSEE